jgi:hypothetical protein
MSPTKVLLATLCMGMMSALAYAADPPATTPANPPGSSDTASTAAVDKSAADKAAADKAAADKAKSSAAARTEPGGITPDQAKTLRVAGYRPELRRGGVVVYCRSEEQIGSLFEHKSCGPAEDILRSVIDSQEAVSRMQHGQTH